MTLLFRCPNTLAGRLVGDKVTLTLEIRGARVGGPRCGPTNTEDPLRSQPEQRRKQPSGMRFDRQDLQEGGQRQSDHEPIGLHPPVGHARVQPLGLVT